MLAPAQMTVQTQRPVTERFQRESWGKPVLPLHPAELYRYGHLIRLTEQLLLRLFSEGLLSGTTHTCLGQELCQMSVVRALNDADDAVLSNHRNHGHFLTYSGQFQGLIAEIMGREAGVCKGIGGSQHLAYGHFHSNGVQAGMTAIGAGLALARKRRGSPGIVATIIGDGTLGQGLVYESLNLASVWELPVLFVVENNRIAQTTPTAETTGGSIEARGGAFGLWTRRLSDDQPDFFERAEAAVQEVRRTRRPGFLVIDTMRMGPHSKGDDLRDAAEMAAIAGRDPLDRLGRALPAGERDEIEEQNREFLREAEQAASASPPSRETHARHHAYRPSRGAPRASGAAPAGLNVRGAINAALRELLEESGDVILLGEDLHDPYGGAFKVTAGLSTRWPDRVISTPISEAGIIGSAIGLALAGRRPVVEVMFADFLTLGMDQIYNHAVKFPGMFEQIEVPMVIRTPSGGRRGYGPTHSQSPENLLAGVPGLTVVFPSRSHAVGELLKNAVRHWPNPSVVFEHKLMYSELLDRRDYEDLTPEAGDLGSDLFPTLVRRCEDPDVTLVCYGGMLPYAERVEAELAAEELAVEIVVPSLLSPLPRKSLTGLLRGRKRVAVIEEGHAETGFGAGLGSALAEAGFSGKFARLGTPPVPIPAARSLEAQIVPDERRIMETILNLFGW